MGPLLGKDLETNNEKTSDREMGRYIKPVSGQRFGKHVPAAMVTRTTRGGETGCCLRGPRLGVVATS
jgi:hypothetical protein